MNPKKKKIYTILIIGTLVLSAAILGWSQFGVGSGPQFPDPGLSSGALPIQIIGDGSSSFNAPAVFPSTNQFRTEVLGSNAFMKLRPYQPVNADGQLGRPDPFSY
jgi:hypothetical protein